MKIGFVGLGQMGSVMAPHLLGKTREVIGHDLKNPGNLPAALRFEHELAGLAECEVIITMLPDGAVVTRVVETLLDAGYGGFVIDMSSSHPDVSRKLETRLADRGLDFLDAPVSGGVSRARNAELMIMAGGSTQAYGKAAPLLALMGNPLHLGKAGCGHAMKALNNYVSAAGLIASFEALATARQLGIEPARFLEVINRSTGRNNTTEVKLERFVLSEQFDSGFALALMAKDVAIANSLMQAAKFDGPVTEAVLQQLRDGLADLGTEADHTALFRHLTRPR